MPARKVLFFLDGDVPKPIVIGSGQLVSVEDLKQRPDLTEKKLETALNEMTTDNICQTARSLGLRITNAKATGKPKLISSVVSNWQIFQNRASKKSQEKASSSGSGYNVAPVEEEHRSDGYHQIKEGVWGYEMGFIQGIPHILTHFGAYQIDEDVETFVHKNNVIFRKEVEGNETVSETEEEEKLMVDVALGDESTAKNDDTEEDFYDYTYFLDEINQTSFVEPMTVNIKLGIVNYPIRTVSNALWSKIVEHFFISAGVSKNHFDDFIFRVGESTIETWDGGFSLENLDLVDGSVVYASLRGSGGGKGGIKAKKDVLKAMKMEKFKGMIEKVKGETTFDIEVQNVLSIPPETFISQAISFLNVEQLNALLKVQDEEIEHGERIVKKLLH